MLILGFHYDAIDSKFHQITAGRQNIGGSGGGEVFTWTADHNSGGFDLNMDTADVTFGSLGASTLGGSNTRYTFTAGGSVLEIGTAGLLSVLGNLRPHSDSAYTLGTSLRYWSNFYTDAITMQTNGQITNLGTLAFGSGNNIEDDASGNMEYSLGSSFDQHEFFAGAAQMTIHDGGVTMFNVLDVNGSNLKMRGGVIELDVDGDSTIFSLGDDNVQFQTGASVRMALSNLGLLMVEPITMSGADIEMDSNDVDFASGGTVDFHDIVTSASAGGASALPALPVAYFTVRYRGATRYIPYYS